MDGIELCEGDVEVTRYFDAAQSTFAATQNAAADAEHLPLMENHATREVLVLLDCRLYPDMLSEGLQREMVNRVQRLRKKLGLQPTDSVNMFYKLLHDVENQLQRVLEPPVVQDDGFLVRVLKRRLLPLDSQSTDELQSKFLGKEEQEVSAAVGIAIACWEW